MGRQADQRMWKTIWELSRIGPEYERKRRERREVARRTRALLQERVEARAAVGLCSTCNEMPFTGSRLCFRHLIFSKLQVAGLTKSWMRHPVNQKRRERVVKYLWGQYTQVLGGSTPLREDEALREAFRIRYGFHIRWGGAKGVIKFARLIEWIERLAEERRNGRV